MRTQLLWTKNLKKKKDGSKCTNSTQFGRFYSDYRRFGGEEVSTNANNKYVNYRSAWFDVNAST